jgi:hypothetical protein
VGEGGGGEVLCFCDDHDGMSPRYGASILTHLATDRRDDCSNYSPGFVYFYISGPSSSF